MVLELNHVGIQVENIDVMIDFYQKFLDARVLNEAIIPATNTRCVYMQIAME